LNFGAFIRVSGGIPVRAASDKDKLEIVSGMGVRTDEEIVIESEEGDYLTKKKDISDMVGKLVEVSGVVSRTVEGGRHGCKIL